MIGRVYVSVGVVWAVMTILGALVGGYLGTAERLGPRGTIIVAAIGYTIPFFWTLFGSIRDATSGWTRPSGIRRGRSG